jgi:hypothetical protein
VTKSIQAKPKRLAVPSGIRFIYFGRPRRGERHQGVMTLAWRINEERHEVEIGFAYCSPLDSWAKGKGRSIAMTRLATMVIRAPYLYQPRRVALEIAHALMTHDFQTAAQVCRAFPSSEVRRHVPGWSRDLAKRLQKENVNTRIEKVWRQMVDRQFKKFSRRPSTHAPDAFHYACIDEAAPVDPNIWQKILSSPSMVKQFPNVSKLFNSNLPTGVATLIRRAAQRKAPMAPFIPDPVARIITDILRMPL